jgi:hypothetical protein
MVAKDGRVGVIHAKLRKAQQPSEVQQLYGS